MANFFRPFIRMSSFIRKEIVEILRQPRLIFTLVLGPFLILLIFGVGYRNEPRQLRTLFVAPPGSVMAKDIQRYAPTIGPQLIYEGIDPSQADALQRLKNGQVDLVVVAPSDAYQKITTNQQATFTLFHNEIDPFQVNYVVYFGQFYVDEVNRRVLTAMTAQSQAEAKNYQSDLQAAQQNSAAMRAALQSGDTAAMQQHQQALGQNLDALTLALGASAGLLSGVQQNTGSDSSNNSGADVLSALNDARQSQNQLSQTNSADKSAQLAALDRIDSDLAKVNQQLSLFESISPDILVNPFTSDTRSVTPLNPTPMGFYAPAVLALLLQHLAVTFAALSIVRERIGGTLELFRVSPLSAAEALLGKYISYLIFGSVIAAILTALVVYAIHVPMLGNWGDFALVVAGVLFTSLTIGFIISIVSQTDSQAVQYSMIILLTAVFFSGFIMSLDMISPQVRIISWAIPTTYGAILLRNIMLRGDAPNLLYLGGLYAIGLGLLVIAWLLLRRLFSRARE
jgi:ABC-2 type transport system permease protein